MSAVVISPRFNTASHIRERDPVRCSSVFVPYAVAPIAYPQSKESLEVVWMQTDVKFVQEYEACYVYGEMFPRLVRPRIGKKLSRYVCKRMGKEVRSPNMCEVKKRDTLRLFILSLW
ncbi:hypothetical protein Tco_0116591 [Tanacetum coccineum]|uniref:Uncharacterized protein n=1 Tax=Tanacetum coccineum TaxID=301880 RepID=A0ABQ5GBE1_9ASTR